MKGKKSRPHLHYFDTWSRKEELRIDVGVTWGGKRLQTRPRSGLDTRSRITEVWTGFSRRSLLICITDWESEIWSLIWILQGSSFPWRVVSQCMSFTPQCVNVLVFILTLQLTPMTMMLFFAISIYLRSEKSRANYSLSNFSYPEVVYLPWMVRVRRL